MKFFIYSLTVSLFYLSPALGKTKAETPPSSPSTIINRFFSTDQDDIENWPPSFARTRRYNYPALNVTETDKTYVLEFEVPGYQKQNLNVSLIHRQLTLTGKREKTPQNKSSKKQHIAYQESMYGEFSRTITLPEDISQDNMAAALKDGILTITVQKDASQQKSKNKKIPIN